MSEDKGMGSEIKTTRYDTLNDLMTKTWSGMTTKQYKPRNDNKRFGVFV